MKRTFTCLAAALISTAIGGAAAAQEFARIGGGLAGTYPLFSAKLSELINNNIDFQLL